MSIEVFEQKSEIALAVKKEGINMDGISDAVQEGYGKIMACLAEQGKGIAGPPYCAYMNGNEDFSCFDVELGIPVSEPVEAPGDLYMSQTAEGKAVSIMYKGPYKEMDKAYMELMQYATENKMELTGLYYDFYISNPEDTPESELLTKIVYMIK